VLSGTAKSQRVSRGARTATDRKKKPHASHAVLFFLERVLLAGDAVNDEEGEEEKPNPLASGCSVSSAEGGCGVGVGLGLAVGRTTGFLAMTKQRMPSNEVISKMALVTK
jgi:hypothetical protein